jgi:hypothetical protein
MILSLVLIHYVVPLMQTTTNLECFSLTLFKINCSLLSQLIYYISLAFEKGILQ